MLGSRIRMLRKINKMTQQNLADKLNLAKSTISQYENAVNQPDNTTLQKIADIFSTSTDYLLGRTDDLTSIKYEKSITPEFNTFINNPEHGIFFKEYLEAPDVRKKELMLIWKIIQEAEKARKLEERQGEK